MKAVVVEIGDSAYFEDYKILILFGEMAPPSIKEFSIIHRLEGKPPTDLLKVGGTITFGDKQFMIEEVGEVANQTFYDLGHTSLYFGLEEGTELLPGAVLLTPYELPEVKVGDTIVFFE